MKCVEWVPLECSLLPVEKQNFWRYAPTIIIDHNLGIGHQEL